MWQPGQPYNQLPLLAPEASLETRTILKACIPARVALGKAQFAADIFINQDFLSNTMLLLEANASSHIDDVVCPVEDSFRASRMNASKLDAGSREVLLNQRALEQGFRALRGRPFNTWVALVVCSAVKGEDVSVREGPGRTFVDGLSGEAVYTPPLGEPLIRDLLRNWEEFMHAEDVLDPLVKMAVAHYQFEAIHPFYDGSGRTGRILNMLFLIDEGLLASPILCLSRYIRAHKTTYLQLLQAVTRDGDWEDWILFMLDAVTETATWMTEKLSAVGQLIEHTTDVMRERMHKIESPELIHVLFQHPYCRIQDLMGAGIAKRQTASVYLRKLTDAGVLTEMVDGKEKLFRHDKLMTLVAAEAHDFDFYT